MFALACFVGANWQTGLKAAYSHHPATVTFSPGDTRRVDSVICESNTAKPPYHAHNKHRKVLEQFAMAAEN